VSCTGLDAVLIEAFKEPQARLEAQQAQIDALRAQLAERPR